MLAEREQGGGKGVALFAPLRLGYAVADAVVIPPLVFRRHIVLSEASWPQRFRNFE